MGNNRLKENIEKCKDYGAEDCRFPLQDKDFDMTNCTFRDIRDVVNYHKDCFYSPFFIDRANFTFSYCYDPYDASSTSSSCYHDPHSMKMKWLIMNFPDQFQKIKLPDEEKEKQK